jgi:hypothetical protein
VIIIGSINAISAVAKKNAGDFEVEDYNVAKGQGGDHDKWEDSDFYEYGITFLGFERTSNGVKFYYEVHSGEDPPIFRWELISPAFKPDMLLGVSEKPYEYKPQKNTLRFNLKYGDEETRVV